jgi:4-hydroxybenzoate polyprenyltransferase
LTVRDLLQLARPGQWSKNGILFAGLIFSQNLLHPAFFLRSLAAFFVFCLASSAIYMLNDLCDIERDRLHPVKRSRPLAAGRANKPQVTGIVIVLVLVSLGASRALGWPFLASLLAFLALNAAYSFFFRSVVVLDVMLIAISFVIRAVAGVMVLRPVEAGIELSPWLLVCTLFLALFLALGKRRHELGLLEGDAAGHRASLGDYSRAFLDQMIAIVSAATLIAYAIYTIAPATVSKFQSRNLVITIPFVAYGIFRYLFLIQEGNLGGNPSRALYRDVPLLATIASWLVAVAAVLYKSRG